MKKRSRVLLFVILMAAVFASAAAVSAAPRMQSEGFAANTAIPRQKAKAAYRDFLSKKYIVMEDGVRVTASKTRFALASVDGDDIPELIVDTYKQHPSNEVRYIFYTYKNGTVREITQHDETVTLKGYYKKENTYKYAWSGLSADFRYYTGLNTAFWAGANQAEGYYEWRGTPVSKAKFRNNMKSRVGSTKYTAFSFYMNTAENRRNHI